MKCKTKYKKKKQIDVQMDLKHLAVNVLMTTSVPISHVKMVAVVVIIIHQENMNAFVHLVLRDNIVNWNYQHLAYWLYHSLSLLQLFHVPAHSFVSIKPLLLSHSNSFSLSLSLSYTLLYKQTSA